MMGDCETEMGESITHSNLPSFSSLFFCFWFIFSHSDIYIFCMLFFSSAVGKGTSLAVDSSIMPQTPDDASFELVPSPFLLKEQKETVRIVLHKIFHTLISGNITQLAYCRHATNNIFSMDWAPLYVRPLRAIFD